MPALPITTVLGEREPAYSYLSRLADRNAVDPHALCRDLGMDLKAIHHGSHEAILSLADVGGIDPASLLAWTPWSAPLEWSGLKVSASWAFGLLARCFLVLVGDIPKSYAGAACCNAGASVRSGSGLL
uniref:TniQ family protein n=1 Tax=Thioclava sp. GXIMD2076 TaxID=3131931 RepID=UPI0040402693